MITVAANARLERVQAANVLAAHGSRNEATTQAALAGRDWRDLAVNAGLAGADWEEVLDRELGTELSMTERVVEFRSNV